MQCAWNEPTEVAEAVISGCLSDMVRLPVAPKHVRFNTVWLIDRLRVWAAVGCHPSDFCGWAASAFLQGVGQSIALLVSSHIGVDHMVF